MTVRLGVHWTRRTAVFLLALLLPFGCAQPPQPDPHYVLGGGYQAGAVWYYPHESYDLTETGLASVFKEPHPPLTSNGELFDQTALAGAHPTLQLPAIVRLTNLENGLQIMLRLNDRGSGDPRRLVEITTRAAALLDMTPDSVTRVRLEVMPAESRAAVEAVGKAPDLAVEAVPRGTVTTTDLAPPPGVQQGHGRSAPSSAFAVATEATAAVPPLRLPEARTQTVPQPGRLMVRLDTFDQLVYAREQQAKLSGSGAQIITLRNGRHHEYRVEAGPFADVAQADAVLLRALSLGIPDARIVID